MSKSLSFWLFGIVAGFCLAQILRIKGYPSELYELEKELSYHQGYAAALDTVMSMADAQINSDTTVTELRIIDKDTVVYFLEKRPTTTP